MTAKKGWTSLNYDKCFKSGKLMIPESDIQEVYKTLKRKNPCSYYICADCGMYHLTSQLNPGLPVIGHGQPSKKKKEERRKQGLKRRRRIKGRSEKKKARDEVRAEVLVDLLLERGNECEIQAPTTTDRNGVVTHSCRGVATDGHEKLPRSAGGDPADPDNILLCCRQCHDYVHLHPEESRRKGWMLSRYE